MENLLKRIGGVASKQLVRAKTIIYFRVMRHAEEDPHNISLRECYRHAKDSDSDGMTLGQRITESHYAQRYGSN